MKIKVGIVDDHQLFLKSLSLMLETLGDFIVTLEANNGRDLQAKIMSSNIPDIFLIDVNMPEIGGVETVIWLHKKYPQVYLVALSMNDKDQTIINMFRAGCCAYLLKDIHPAELGHALHEVLNKGYYNADITNVRFRKLLMISSQISEPTLTVREQEFLKLACSELTYKQIAFEMKLSERTIDGYRESLFQKLHVQSRVGLCLEGLRKELVTL